jgi:hypothetical protein
MIRGAGKRRGGKRGRFRTMAVKNGLFQPRAGRRS